MIFTIIVALLGGLGRFVFSRLILQPNPDANRGTTGIWSRRLKGIFAEVEKCRVKTIAHIGLTSPISVKAKVWLIIMFLLGDILSFIVINQGYPSPTWGVVLLASLTFWIPATLIRRDLENSAEPQDLHKNIRLQFFEAARKIRPHEATIQDRQTSIIDAKCGVCLESFDDSNSVAFCSECESPHHVDCWEYFEKCSVYGCRERKFNTLDLDTCEIWFFDELKPESDEVLQRS